MKVLVTGAAGFIGYHVCKLLQARGDDLVGIDNLNDYYDPSLKLARLVSLGEDFHFEKIDIADFSALSDLFRREGFDAVINLAAQAGVRYSLENPQAYVSSNLDGFVNILECCRHFPVRHLVYASSSSVYGNNSKIPFEESDCVDHPQSLYAATKKANELLASCYNNLYSIPATGLRFFTVYGPWGRPDMAPMIFAKAILAGDKIRVFNNGNMLRDFTYISDIASAVVAVLDKVPKGHEVYNIGCSNPVNLMDFISSMEKALGKAAQLDFCPMQAGDVVATYASCAKLKRDFGYKPQVQLAQGLQLFVEWYISDNNPIK